MSGNLKLKAFETFLVDEGLEGACSDSKGQKIEQKDDSTFIYGDKEYLVLNDAEADAKTSETIRESLWTFRPWFICKILRKTRGIGFPGLSDLIQIAQEKNCENANDLFLLLVDFNNNHRFITSLVIKYEGRGHSLADYDFVEHELKIENECYFIYRII